MQAADSSALIDTRQGGPSTLGTREGRCWMSSLGGPDFGYETPPILTGLASTCDPDAPVIPRARP